MLQAPERVLVALHAPTTLLTQYPCISHLVVFAEETSCLQPGSYNTL